MSSPQYTVDTHRSSSESFLRGKNVLPQKNNGDCGAVTSRKTIRVSGEEREITKVGGNGLMSAKSGQSSGSARSGEDAGKATGANSERIESMYRSDRLGAWTFVAVLWVTVLFVLVMIWQVVDDGTIRAVLAVAAGALLLFNTASIGAMVKHYEEDKEFIYGLDIHHLDAARAARRK